MGLLSSGTPLTWEETKRYADHVRDHGIKQFIRLYHRLKDRTNDSLYFGDEVEYTLVKFNHEEGAVKLNLKAEHYLERLRKLQEGQNADVFWTHEYSSYMIEGTPGKPYGALSGHFNTVEDNMRKRREQVLSVLESSDESILSITVFPRLGCHPFTSPEYVPQPRTSASRSLYFPDEAINQGHPRFATLTRNIRERRGDKVVINVPIFIDVNTAMPFTEDTSNVHPEDMIKTKAAMKTNHIYMDAMGFGMGCSCLQMTFQACNILEARHLYDQLTPLTPIMMAISAASPIYKGYLADIDHRWSVIAASVDDRTREERGVVPLKDDKFVINKSRYDSIDSYLSEEGRKYNDEKLVYDETIYNTLIDGGIDDLLAQHFAHLFIRDPISLFSEKVLVKDELDTDHFENIQSTNWQTMRFKPPPPNSKIGWRVEFRPTECQLTDFENAALTVFVVMMTRVILSYNLNLLIPISKVDENIRRAQTRNAVLDKKFYFRKDIITHCSPPEASECSKKCESHGKESSTGSSDQKPVGTEQTAGRKCPDDLQELTINEIVNGKPGHFTGLIPYIKDYMDNIDVDVDTYCSINQYLDFIKQRASGELMTTAKYIREFIRNHPEYKKDSIITEQISYDLLRRCDHISKELASCPELVPPSKTKSYSDIPKATLNTHKKPKRSGNPQ